MKRLVLAIITLASAIPHSSFARERWALEECIEYSLQHNLSLMSKQVEVSLRQNELTARRFALLPSVVLYAGRDWNWGRSVDVQELMIVKDRLSKATSVSVSGSAELFHGFSGQYAKLASAEALEAARLAAESVEEQIKVSVTQAYLQLMLSRQLLEFSEKNMESITLQRSRTSLLVESGRAPMSALSEIEAQVATERASVVEAECNVRNAEMELRRLMNLPDGEPMAVEVPEAADTLAPPVRVPSPDDIVLAADRAAAVRSAVRSINAARHRLASAKGLLAPAVTVTAGYGSYFTSTVSSKPARQLEENRNPSLSLGITLPLFTGLEAFTSIRARRLEVKSAVLEAEQEQKSAFDRISAAVLEAGNCYQKYLAASESLKSMEALLRVNQAKFDVGAATALDYVIARSNLNRAVSECLQARWHYIYQMKIIEIYTQ